MALTGVAQWVGVVPQMERLSAPFLVRAHAWVVGHVPSWGRAGGN